MAFFIPDIPNLFMFGNVTPGPFDPMSLPWGLALEAYDSATLFSNTAGSTPATTTVAHWKDKSVGAKNFTRSGATSLNPIISTLNGTLQALLFDGTDDYLENTGYTLPEQGTVFFLVEPKATLSNKAVVTNPSTGTPAGRRQLWINTAGNWAVGYGTFNSDTVTLDSGVPATANTPVVICMDCRGAFVDLYIGGGIPKLSNVATGSGTPPVNTRIGAFTGGGFPANVAIAAVFATQEGTNLSATQRDNMGAYLTGKANL